MSANEQVARFLAKKEKEGNHASVIPKNPLSANEQVQRYLNGVGRSASKRSKPEALPDTTNIVLPVTAVVVPQKKLSGKLTLATNSPLIKLQSFFSDVIGVDVETSISGNKSKYSESGTSIEGDIGILQFLASGTPYVGSGAGQQAEVHEWLLFAPPADRAVKLIAKDLCPKIQDRTYLAGNSLTIADAYVWSLLSSFGNLDVVSKMECLHFARWFDFVQNTGVCSASDVVRQPLRY